MIGVGLALPVGAVFNCSVVCHSENRKIPETETAVMYTLEKLLKHSSP